MRFCSCCSHSAAWLSMRALCAKCQRIPGAIHRRIYDWRTGKLRKAA